MLFAEGEPSELVGRIESGAVEVVRRVGDREVVLARLGPGGHTLIAGGEGSPFVFHLVVG